MGVGDNMEVYVVWSEMETNTPTKSNEVHASWTDSSKIPEGWSGQEKDIVLSWPDTADKADAVNITIAMGQDEKGIWSPQIAWEEKNVISEYSTDENVIFSDNDQPKADHNTEIHYIPEHVTLSISVPGGGGSVSKNPNQGTYLYGESVTLTANPSAGWYFDYWTGDLTGSTNPRSIIMDGDKSVTAVFTQYQYTLTISVSPVSTGSVVKNPNQATYTYGTSVQLTANPIAGYEFAYWTGGLTGSSNPDTISMTSSKSVTAYFTKITYDIPVHLGWNLISVPLDPLDKTATVVLDDSEGDGLTIWDIAYRYDPTDTTNHWKSHNDNYGGAQTLPTVDLSMGLWINITSLGDGYLTVTGSHTTSTSIVLSAGWNLIGYPADDDSSYTAGQLKAASKATLVEGYSVDGAYNLQVLGDSYVLQNGESYWLYVPAQYTWTVDW